MRFFDSKVLPEDEIQSLPPGQIVEVVREDGPAESMDRLTREMGRLLVGMPPGAMMHMQQAILYLGMARASFVAGIGA